MNIGYARVPTFEQNLDLQLQVLRKAGCKKIFREKVSGSSRERRRADIRRNWSPTAAPLWRPESVSIPARWWCGR